MPNFKTLFTLVLAIFLLTLSQASTLSAQVSLEVYTDKASYTQSGESLTVQTAISNTGASVAVDLHIVIIPPSGSTAYAWPDWNTELKPALSNFTLPADFTLPKSDLLNLEVNTSLPFS